MRSRPDTRCAAVLTGLIRTVACVVLWLMVAMSAPARLHAQPPTPVDGRPGSPAVTRAVDAVKADPDLGAPRKQKVWRWKDTGPQTPAERRLPRWLTWFTSLTAESLRYVVWLAVIVGAALLVGYLVRMSRDGDTAAGFDAGSLRPTHVQDLDIRPESLPRDVGAAAKALWLQGEHRAAVALLYRGALSRLVHGHSLPIRDASTEGDCLALCRTALGADAFGFVETLIRVRQRLVYGHETPQAETVLALCDRFTMALSRTAMRNDVPGGAA